MIAKLGYRRSDLTGAAKPFVAAASGSGDVNMSGWIDYIRDQGSSSSCAGESFARACSIVTKGAGRYPSYEAIYTLARARERARKSDPLPDEGCMPVDCALGMADIGICPESIWMDLGATLGDELPWDVVQACVRAPDVSEIVETGQARVERIRAALSLLRPVVIGMGVDQSFMDYTSGAWDGPSGKILGGHATCVIGCDASSFLICNSWSSGWGMSGLYRMTNAAMASHNVQDAFVVEGAPVL